MGRGQVRGFTLIEMMISIAILAIVGAIAVSSLVQFRGVVRERQYERSLALAQRQLARLRQAPFETLPPEVVKVGPGGRIKLSQRDLVEGSVRLWRPDGATEVAPGKVDLEQGVLELSPDLAGQQVVVDYQFQLPDTGEAHYLDQQGGITLENPPIRRLEGVLLARGDQLVPVTNYSLQGDRVVIKGAPDKGLVVADYLGGPDGNQAGGRFLDHKMQDSGKPSDLKMITLQEPYNGPFRVSLTLLKVRP